mgnify:CR=1 FL=1
MGIAFCQMVACGKGVCLKIITVNKNINYSDYNYYLEGPEKFLSLMYYAKYVITNSFHSVAFSLIFEKQFVVVNRTEAINTRMRDLLGLFDLSSLLINSVEQFDAVNEMLYVFGVVKVKLELVLVFVFPMPSFHKKPVAPVEVFIAKTLAGAKHEKVSFNRKDACGFG